MASMLKRFFERVAGPGARNPALISKLARETSSSASSPINRFATNTHTSIPTPLTRFTVLGAGNQHDLVEKVAREADSSGFRRAKAQNAVVILASRNYAPWLADKAFMTNFLESFAPPAAKAGEDQEELNVLVAAMDALCPQSPLFPARHGFSVIQGPVDHLLPGLWAEASEESVPDKSKLEKAAVTFRVNTPEIAAGCFATTITLPLANTLFQNSRPFTLLASRWGRDTPGAPLTMSHTVTKPSQEVVCAGTIPTADRQQIFLNPITQPRTIVSGLGNIVRQIDVDGEAVPASQELEAAVSKTFNRRRRIDGPDALPKGALGVWALITPPEANTMPLRALNAMQLSEVAEDASLEDEMTQALRPERFKIGLGFGQRIFQVVSGGGGWGKKQGLLSLDTTTQYPLTGDEDLEAFIRSFSSREGGETDATLDSGVVAPGSTIQFFITPTPQMPDRTLVDLSPRSLTEGLYGELDAFGVTPRVADKPRVGPLGESWTILPGRFGAVSAECMYLYNMDAERAKDTPTGRLQTKIDVPDSFITTFPFSEEGLRLLEAQKTQG
ncbi:hypothetical protein ACHAQA_002710 [Verticillium albo-atrum]